MLLFIYILFLTMMPLLVQAEEEVPLITPEDNVSESMDNETIDSELNEVKVIPQIRRESLADPPPFTIPLHIMRPFLSRPQIMTLENFEEKPRIVGFGREHIAGSAGNEIYASNIDYSDINTNFEILRLGQAYIDPDSGDVLGYEALHIGEAEMVKTGEPAKLFLVRTSQEVQMDDRLVPAEEYDLTENFVPTPASDMIEGKIITVLNGVSEISIYSIVAINKGEEDGLIYGNTLQVVQQPVAPCNRPLSFSIRTYAPISCQDSNISAYLPSFISSDEENPELPYEVVGKMMIFRVFNKVSYGIVLEATSSMRIGDGVRGGNT